MKKIHLNRALAAKKKKLTILFALLCASVMGWAAKYCNSTITADDGVTTVTLTCVQPTPGTYVMTIVGGAYFGGLIGEGNYFELSGVGGNQVKNNTNEANRVCNFDEGSRTLTVTMTADRAPKMYTPLYLDISGQKTFTTIQNQVFEWPTECASCTDVTEPTISAVEAGNITSNSVELAITASDNDGGTGIARYIVKNGDTQIAASSTSPISVSGLTSGTTYNNIKVIAIDGCDNVSSAFAVDEFETLSRPSECIGAKGHFDNPSAKRVYYQIDYVDGKAIISLRSLTGHDLDFAEVHITGTGDVYAPMTSDGNGGYTYTINNPTVGAEWYLRFLYSDTNMPGNEQTSKNLSTTDPNIIYYKVGECTSTATENVNIALSSAGSSATASSTAGPTTFLASEAIDDNTNSRWASEASDPQWICVDFGARKVFNKVQLVHENAYIKTYDIQVSDDGINFITIEHVSETLAGFPYTQSIDLGGKFAARYMRIYGTERGTNHGYSLWELRAMYATTPVLTTYTASLPSRFATIGSNYQISVVAKDQLGNDFAVNSTYSINPIDAGSITEEGVYTPAVEGDATITVSGEGKETTIVVRNEVSDNLAYNKTATSGHDASADYAASLANNSNLENRWASGGEAIHYSSDPDKFQDWWYVDLGNTAIYDISEIAIKWETARPNDYDIRVSTDAQTWTTIGTYNTYPVANTDKSLNYQYYSTFLTSVPCRYVGVWARDGYANLAYGISMYDFQVFGLEHVDAGVDVESITLSQTSATLELGESLTLTADVAPVNATDKTITWVSDAEGVATVEDGVITTVSPGTAHITATAHDGSGVYATFTLTVEPVTAKTWWGTQTITDWDPDMDVMWSVTRNADKTLTYTVYFGGDASGKVKQINNGEYHDLVGYDDVNRVASYTTETKYEKGTQLSPKPFFYFGGPRIDLPTSYRVADTNDKPATSVSSVSLNHTSASLEPTEQLQLIVTILPSFVENKAVTWESSNSTIASVTDAGLVTANDVGTATITATSSADGTKTATCTITVVGDLSPETWYGYGKFDVHGKWVAFSYSITRTAERNLYYQTHLSADIAGIAMKINYNDNWYTMSQDESKRNATYTEEGPFVDGNAHNFYFRAEFENGADNNNVTYTIGSSNDALGQAIAIDESADNTSIITAYDEQSVVGIVKRSFTAGNLYTLVLPFDVDAAQTAAKLPGQLTKLNNSYLKDNGDLRLNFVDASAIEAGVPYLYEPSENVTNPAFVGVSVSKDLHHTEPADGYAKYYGIYAPMDANALHEKTNAYVLGSDQYLYAVSDLPNTQTMKALRAYFVLDFPSATPGAPKRLAKVVFNSQETEVATGIENTIANEQNTKILRDGQLLIIREGKTYNAQGQLIK